MALGLLGDPVEAEDAAQEAFLQVFRHLGRFRGDSSFYTWLCRICINLCLRRKEQLRRTRMRDISLDGLAVSDPIEALVRAETPEDELVRGEMRRCVHAELRNLPDEFQTVLVLREIDGLSYEEIGETLGIAMGTVKSRVHRGRSLLRERLKSLLNGARYAS